MSEINARPAVGWIGLGKLGFPCALALAANTGRTVRGYDSRAVQETRAWLQGGTAYPYKEDKLSVLLENPPESFILADSIQEVVQESEIIFISVQTPHAQEFGGETPMPEDRTADFEYGYLVNTVRQIVHAANATDARKPLTLVIISTVLPGTINRIIKPILNKNAHLGIHLVYNPFFIAMGTTIQDFTDPEFVLMGADDQHLQTLTLQHLYREMHHKPFQVMDIESAELTKVAYNTFISMKIVFANTLLEICDKTAADVDYVTDALALATDRIISPAYMKGGMGDGGHCHPRDNIAMSHLAKQLGLSFDMMGMVSYAREAHTQYLVFKIGEWWLNTHAIPVVILGASYKPESDLTGGSPSLLLQEMLKNVDIESTVYDPFVKQYAGNKRSLMERSIFFIGTKHEQFASYTFPQGSVVIDPWGYMPESNNHILVRIGRK